MTGRIEAVCVSGSDLLPLPEKRPNRSGIDKRPVEGIVAVHELGLDGDVQVNKKHHGGEGQAVYAYAQSDADWWATELGRELPLHLVAAIDDNLDIARRNGADTHGGGNGRA